MVARTLLIVTLYVHCVYCSALLFFSDMSLVLIQVPSTRRLMKDGFIFCSLVVKVDSSWNVMAHGDAREGKWRGNWRMEWVASTLHTTLEHGVSSITTADAHTSAASSRLNWRPPADLNGLVRLAERRNMFSARVPSHFNLPVVMC